MKRISLALAAAAVGLTGMAMQPAWSQTVKITPIGSHDGEFCRRDRAMLFEAPDGKQRGLGRSVNVRGRRRRSGRERGTKFQHPEGPRMQPLALRLKPTHRTD